MYKLFNVEAHDILHQNKNRLYAYITKNAPVNF